MTTQRLAILAAVVEGGDHPTAEEVHERVRQRLPRVGLGTVYRNLTLLAGAGIIRLVNLAGEPARFDGKTEAHHHVRCSRCGRIEDVVLPAGNEMREWVSARTHYEVTGHRVEFTGLCPNCKQAARRRT